MLKTAQVFLVLNEAAQSSGSSPPAWPNLAWDSLLRWWYGQVVMVHVENTEAARVRDTHESDEFDWTDTG